MSIADKGRGERLTSQQARAAMAAAKLNLHLHLQFIHPHPKFPQKPKPNLVNGGRPISSTLGSRSTKVLSLKASKEQPAAAKPAIPSKSRVLIVGAASLGLALLLMGFEDHRAVALGPEGPLMEEFWDNMRRYGLYVLTVSTGAIYTLLQPIVELMKSPVTALLVIVMIGGGIFVVSQVVTAMVGLSDFSYDYGY